MQASSPPAPAPPRRGISRPRRLIGALILLGAGSLFFLIFTGRVMTFEIIGPSMEPTLDPGDRVFVSTDLRTPLARGELVVFANPTPHMEGEILVKRVVGVPGDHLTVRGGRLSINGVPEWLPGLGAMPMADVDHLDLIVPPDHVYVLGDNRENSHDSGEFGPLPVAAVIGRVTTRYWPLSKWGPVN